MNQIHGALKQHGNIENPLRQVARDIASRTRVLCLDEFVIIDIGDAMIMAGLLEALFAEGVVLVTTSNAAPDRLYHDGLQRARFLPAIDLISRHCKVVNLDGQLDYRLRFLQQTDLYSVPHNGETESRIRDYLAQHVVALNDGRNDGVCSRDCNWKHEHGQDATPTRTRTHAGAHASTVTLTLREHAYASTSSPCRPARTGKRASPLARVTTHSLNILHLHVAEKIV